MNAVEYFEPIPDIKKIKNTRQKPPILKKRELQRVKKQIYNSNLEQALEITVKIIVNGLLTFVAFTALTKLLPYYQSQQKELAEINLEVRETEVRVKKLREKFERNFDPTLSKKVMERNTHKVDPNQQSIFFVNNNN